MDDETPQEADATLADLARKMTPGRRERFLDAACGGDPQLRAAVEARLRPASGQEPQPASPGADSRQQELGGDPQADAFESLALEAVYAPSEPAREGGEQSGDEAEGRMPIADYCRSKTLDPVARLRLFQDVCRAVDAFHRRGVILGSLSPALVQVGPDGRPTLGPGGPAAKEDPASLRYASPEQILGEPATTAMDVYGLGVVLYELLSGRYPYQVSSPEPGLDELCRAISEQAPERPSQAVARPRSDAGAGVPADAGSSPRQLRRLLDGDLDLIVLKALQKEPERRYPSAAALADDIDRFFAGRPVLAHPPGGLYVAGMFFRRHRAATILGTLLAIALIAGLVSTSLGLARARRARARADAAYETARGAVDDLFARVDREAVLAAPDLVPARTALLESFLRYYEQAGSQSGDHLEDRLESARARRRVGRIYELMSLPEVASWQYEEAIEAFNALEAEAPGSLPAEERAALLGDLGELLRVQPSRRAQARAVLDQARGLLETGLTTKSPPLVRRTLARVLGSLAALEHDEGHAEQAADRWRQSVEINRELASAKSPAVEDRIALAESTIGLGRALAMTPATAGQGVEDMVRGAELRQAIVQTYPQRADQALELARDWRELATLNQSLGQTDRAIEDAGRAIEQLEQLDRRFPETVAYQSGLYLAYDTLSRLLALSNQSKPALERSNQARAVLEQLVDQHPKDRTFRMDLARCQNLIGRLQQRRRAYREALQSFERAVDLLESTPGLDGENHYQLAVNLALAIALIGATEDMPPPDDESTLSPADRLRRQVYGKRAVAAIEQALAQGFGSPELYRTDADLDALRDRPDFQKLLQGLTDRR
jgi:non-specific serine/threonine protein kinase/serine/threonine-protein kinase